MAATVASVVWHSEAQPSRVLMATAATAATAGQLATAATPVLVPPVRMARWCPPTELQEPVVVTPAMVAPVAPVVPVAPPEA